MVERDVVAVADMMAVDEGYMGVALDHSVTDHEGF